jgi:hypothetical protein
MKPTVFVHLDAGRYRIVIDSGQPHPPFLTPALPSATRRLSTEEQAASDAALATDTTDADARGLWWPTREEAWKALVAVRRGGGFT